MSNPARYFEIFLSFHFYMFNLFGKNMAKSKEKAFRKISTSSNLDDAINVCEFMLYQVGVDSFLDALLCNENLIVQDGNDEKISWVKSFLDRVSELLVVNVPEYAESISTQLKIINIINRFFSSLIERRSDTDAVKYLNVSELVSSSLVRGAEDYLVIIDKAEKEIRSSLKGVKFLDTQKSYMIEDSLGNRAHPDSALFSTFNSIFLVLKSTGFIERLKQGDCFDFKKFIPATEDSVTKIAALNFNAMSWRYFDSLQKDIRHCKRKWRYFDNNDNVPDEYKEYVKEYLDIESPSAWRAYEIIAEQRLRQLAKEIYFNTYEVLSSTQKASGEYHINMFANKIVIEKILSLDPDDERNKCLGLTLCQWLEGYAALQDFIRGCYKKEDAASLTPLLEKKNLIQVFLDKGMPEGIASSFLDNVVFGPNSVDLYDTPVIKFGQQYMLYGPVIKDAILYELVVSNVSRNKEKLSRKGNALERRLFSILDESGFSPKKIKEKRRGQEYEFDVVVKWDDYLFVFECKNRAIPRSPILSKNMWDDYKGHVLQLSRLCGALKTHPDILKKHFGRDHNIRHIVPCLVNGLPFSLDTKLEGVIVTDISALSKFFSDRDITFNSPSGEMKVYSQWSCKQPCLGDFLFFLGNPYQVGLNKRYLSTSVEFLPICEGVLARVEDCFHEEKGWEDIFDYFSQLTNYRNELLKE